MKRIEFVYNCFLVYCAFFVAGTYFMMFVNVLVELTDPKSLPLPVMGLFYCALTVSLGLGSLMNVAAYRNVYGEDK